MPVADSVRIARQRFTTIFVITPSATPMLGFRKFDNAVLHVRLPWLTRKKQSESYLGDNFRIEEACRALGLLKNILRNSSRFLFANAL
jgi:hypothetical protein